MNAVELDEGMVAHGQGSRISMSAIQEAISHVMAHAISIDNLPVDLQAPVKVYFAACAACDTTPEADFLQALADAGWDFTHWGAPRAG